MNATGQQHEAIVAEGNVLVMAGAGTGKTSTLVARVAERLARKEDRVSADRILMVTFTEAAAEEMRSRLRERLEALWAMDPTLSDQVARLDLASIGTLHGFCLRLLREHGVEVGLEPGVTVLDEVESGRLARASWMRWVEAERSGEAGDVALRRWVEGGFDGDFAEASRAVRSVHRYAQTLADPEGWLDGQAALWGGAGLEAWRGWLEQALPDWAHAWAERLSMLEDNPVAAARVERLRSGVPPAGAGRGAWWDASAENDAEYPKGKKTAWGKPLETFFEDVAFLRSLEPRNGADPMAEDWESCRGWMPGLLGAVRGFGREFEEAKRRRGGLDFSDLEQRALDLLVRRPGAAAAWCREHFQMVVVDECQDVNAAQEAILRAVSRDGAGANRFLVGDVKQSIYRFRLAAPQLFQDTAARWSDMGGEGRVIPLTGNFRSAETVLRFANLVCGRLMRPEVGGVGYGAEAALVFGDVPGREALRSASDAVPRVEVHLRVKPRNSGGDDEGEDAAASAGNGGGPGTANGSLPGLAPTATALEARLIAARLKEMKACRAPVWDRRRGAMRPVEWGDMAVLMRGVAGRVRDFAAEFRAAGVPLAARQAGFFEAAAVLDLRALMHCLDNPLLDIPLATVLRSPLGGVWEPDAWAVIRMTARGERDWWTLIQRFAADDNPEALGECEDGIRETAARTRERLRVFLARHERWRRMALRSGAASALEAAVDETGYEAWAAALPDRGETLGNVRRFLDLARGFDAGARGGLYRFLSWLDEQELADTVEAASGDTQDAVRLLTVHRSKGLEFPVVVVAMLGTRFQLTDLTRGRLVREERMGLCPLVQREDGRRYPSAALWLARRRERRELLGEELRLLYVALTRAVDRLLLFGTTTGKAFEERWPEVARRIGPGTDALPVSMIEDATSPLDWLGPVLSAAPGGLKAGLDADVA
ncbi:MAG: UvrD-helicase domain-containing protein [Verrucomicrobiota bacterium]